MAYQAFYRKFRPDHFAEVKGQDHIVKTLQNQLASDRLGHAYLFCGTRGTGKTTTAKILARAINCENPGPNGPCGECEMCKQIAAGNSMNVIEIDAASNNKVEDVRQIIEEVQYAPTVGKFKVYIIDEVHMLTGSAFNALLKTLEEPPSYLVFILATTEAHKLPLTIRSRCQRYDFHRITPETIAKRLRELLDEEGIEAEDEALFYIGKKADGALRDGLSLLEQCVSFYYGEKLTYEKVLKALGAVDKEIYNAFAIALNECDTEGLLTITDQVVREGKDIGLFLDELIGYYRDMMMVKNTSNPEQLVEMDTQSLEQLKELAKNVEMPVIFRYLRVLSEASNRMRYEQAKRTLFEVTVLRLAKPEMEQDLESLTNRIKNLEEKIQNGDFLPKRNVIIEGDTKEEDVLPPPKKELILPEEAKEFVEHRMEILKDLPDLVKKVYGETSLYVDEGGELVFGDPSITKIELIQSHMDELKEAIERKVGKEVRIKARVIQNADREPGLDRILARIQGSHVVIEEQ